MVKELGIRLELAKRELGKSVIRINPLISQEQEAKIEDALYFGVKNTNQIPCALFDKLRENKNYLWLTVDKMADKGRGVDTDLVNPITYRAMTGSTSGGAVNILKGINDFAIGTDGGGSILGPAMSCQLPAMIGSGLDVFVNQESLSTDSITFRGSVGIIAKRLNIAVKVFEEFLGKTLDCDTNFKEKLKIIVPQQGSVTTPDNVDMTEKLTPYIELLKGLNCEFIYVDFTGINNRQTAIDKIEESFNKYHGDIILTNEGPIDVHGYGETIPEAFGKAGGQLTENNGKFLLRAANMCKTTAVTIPTMDIASGLLVIGNYGLKNAMNVIKIARELEAAINLPEVWTRYYLTNQRFNKGFDCL